MCAQKVTISTNYQPPNHHYFSYQPVCYSQETQLDRFVQILAPEPVPLGSWMAAELSCCKQVWGAHMGISASLLE